MSTFIDEYLRHTSIYESPISFWRWSAFATIAGILSDRCYLPQGDSRLYPNIYVLFLAESSGHRKGRPVDLSETLITRINNTKVISGRASVQAILDELARTETNKLTGKVVKSSSAIIYASELSAGIVADTEGLKTLTDIYDMKTNPYKHRLRTGPSFNLERIALTMLAATNEDMIKDFFSMAEIKGQEERKKSLDCVLMKLMEIFKINGIFELSEDAAVEYETWYDPFRQSYAAKKEATGVVGRIHTSILKLAMILAANDLTLEIQKEHIEKSIEYSLGLIPNYGIFTMHHALTDTGKAGGVVISSLLDSKNNFVARKMIMRSNWQSFDSDILDRALLALEEAGMIQSHHGKDGIGYSMTKEGLEMMK